MLWLLSFLWSEITNCTRSNTFLREEWEGHVRYQLVHQKRIGHPSHQHCWVCLFICLLVYSFSFIAPTINRNDSKLLTTFYYFIFSMRLKLWFRSSTQLPLLTQSDTYIDNNGLDETSLCSASRFLYIAWIICPGNHRLFHADFSTIWLLISTITIWLWISTIVTNRITRWAAQSPVVGYKDMQDVSRIPRLPKKCSRQLSN